MPRGHDGFGVGADFIGHFAGAAECAVAADNDKVNFSALHQMAGGVVGDDLMGNFLLRQFPRRQRGALRARTCFVAPDVESFPGGMRRINRRGCRANVHKRQPAGVAMGQYPGAWPYQFSAVPPDGLAMAHVFIGKFLGGGERE